MFSNNDKISPRQIKRLLIFDLFGASSLLLPAQLAKAGGIGLWSILAGSVMAFLYLWLLVFLGAKAKQDYFTYLRDSFGKLLARALYVIYAAIGAIVCAWAAKILSELACATLLDDKEYPVALFLVLLLAVYGGIAGLEARARVYEVLFWVLAAPFVLMLLFCIRQVQPVQWFPLFRQPGQDSLGSFWSGAWQCFAAFLPLTFFLFLLPNLQKKKKSARSSAWALVISAVSLAAVYLILIGIFGAKALAVEKYPVVTLMGMVKIPGDFIKRMDAVMVSVWFFTLYALVAASFYYGVSLMYQAFAALPDDPDGAGRLEKQGLKTKCAWFFVAALIIYGAAYFFHQSSAVREKLSALFYLLVTPFAVVVPLAALGISWLRGKRGTKENVDGGKA